MRIDDDAPSSLDCTVTKSAWAIWAASSLYLKSILSFLVTTFFFLFLIHICRCHQYLLRVSPDVYNPSASSEVYTLSRIPPPSQKLLPLAAHALTMSGSSEKPWSDNPYAPQIPYWLYFAEKANLAGSIIGGIFYGTSAHAHTYPNLPRSIVLGIVIVLFFQCMSLLLSSTYRARRGVRWGLLAYTVASFSIVTIYTAVNLDLQTISFVDNREFPGTDQFPPGPLGYQYFIYSAPLAIVGNLMFLLNNWLADGLLVSSVPGPILRAPHRSYSCSSIVATLFSTRGPGSLPSRVSCTSPLWVCSSQSGSNTYGSRY